MGLIGKKHKCTYYQNHCDNIIFTFGSSNLSHEEDLQYCTPSILSIPGNLPGQTGLHHSTDRSSMVHAPLLPAPLCRLLFQHP